MHYFLEYVTRRKTNFILSLAILIFECCLLMKTEDKESTLYSIFYFAYRFLVSMAFLSVYLMNYESFPTQIRAVGATFGYLIGNTSGILQPHLVTVWKKYNWNVLYSFMAICILSFFPNYFLKETFKIPPP
jgi:sugar phosphate permease